MNVHVYNELDGPTKRAQTDAEVRQVLAKLAADTGTRDLVVAVYLVDEGDAWRGHLASTKMLSPGAFRDGRGKWRFIRRFPQPASLPSKFFLIRIMIGPGCRRRKVFSDGYGMTIITKDFYAFLAVLFAHELHHFRRHHLGLHEGEREICANRWAVQQATKAGYVFQASWRKRKSRKMATNTPNRRSRLALQDPPCGSRTSDVVSDFLEPFSPYLPQLFQRHRWHDPCYRGRLSRGEGHPGAC